MGESEARTETYSWSPEPKPDSEHQANLRKIAKQKQALDELTMRVDGSPASAKPKQRQHNPKTERFYARIREVPRNVSLKECCSKFDAAQRRFSIPKVWQDDGCPTTWSAAFKDKKWRGKIHDQRQNAWRKIAKKAV